MVSTVLRSAGGVRVDHIIGLFRLWWIPEGHGPTEGTYLRYDHEALIGILALEAVRAGAVVVGEDLGTVEPWVREYLAGARHSRYVDPVVRVRVRRFGRSAAARMVARVLPGVGDHA